jgi:hypothetical protein
MTGYVSSYLNPFPDSVEMMKQIAPDFGFSGKQIEEATTVIYDSLKENPETDPGKALSDSIYDYYGRIDCLPKLKLLFEEISNVSDDLSIKGWYKDKAADISDHHFHTATAEMLRTVSADQQVTIIEEFISGL